MSETVTYYYCEDCGLPTRDRRTCPEHTPDPKEADEPPKPSPATEEGWLDEATIQELLDRYASYEAIGEGMRDWKEVLAALRMARYALRHTKETPHA